VSTLWIGRLIRAISVQEKKADKANSKINKNKTEGSIKIINIKN